MVNNYFQKIYIDMTREELIQNKADKVAEKAEYKLKKLQLECYDCLEEAFMEGVKLAKGLPVSLLHSSEEKPNDYPILCQNKFNNVWVQHNLEDYTWEEFISNESIVNWVYITDIFLK